MNRDVFITCAVTGAGDTPGNSPHVPVTPQKIADAAIEATRAGAAIAHIHVRDPQTGKAATIKRIGLRGQARLDETAAVETQVLGSDPKRLHIVHVLTSGGGTTIAAAEQMLLHVDTAAGRAVPAEGAVLAAMTRLAEAPAGLPRLADQGRAIGIGPRAS